MSRAVPIKHIRNEMSLASIMLQLKLNKNTFQHTNVN